MVSLGLPGALLQILTLSIGRLTALCLSIFALLVCVLIMISAFHS